MLTNARRIWHKILQSLEEVLDSLGNVLLSQYITLLSINFSP